MDLFTQRRLIRLVEDFKTKSGQPPTLQDLAQNGFDSDCVKDALKLKLIAEFYVTLTSGSIVKVYRLG